MANLTKQFRSHNSPSPIYGIRPGFNVGDFDGQQSNPFVPAGTGTYPNITGIATAITGVNVVAGARAVKITLNITGTGTVDLSVKSGADSFVAVVADYGVLGAGSYDFYLGGWASPVGDGSAYTATQYGPSGAKSQATSGLSADTDNNYVGQTYNPVNFLSLDGFTLQFTTAVVGSVVYTVEVLPIS